MNSFVRTAVADNSMLALMRRGYDDAYAGKPFSSDFDTMTEMDQRNYEVGRMMAAMLRGARGKRAKWKLDERSGALFRRALGDAAGRAAILELNEYAARDSR